MHPDNPIKKFMRIQNLIILLLCLLPAQIWPQQYPATAIPTPKPRFQWFRRAPAADQQNAAAAYTQPARTAPAQTAAATPASGQSSSQKTARSSASSSARSASAGSGKSAPGRSSKAAASPAAVKSSKTKTSTLPTTGPRPISSWPAGQKLIALTYDDGPSPVITSKLVSLLRQKNVHATFFMQGDSIKAFPAKAREVAQSPDAFEIANHSVTHKQFTRLSDEGIRRELEGCNDLITSVSGRSPRLMRPPYGAWNGRVRDICENMGLKIILWNVDTNDWRKRTADQIVSTILTEAHDGAIILMHDRFNTSLEATGRVIDALSAQGYRFVTVSELIAAGPRLQGGKEGN